MRHLAMLFKIPINYPAHQTQKGVTILELVIAIFILMMLIPAIILIANPAEHKAKARDDKRFSDLSVLESAINHFHMDNDRYPELNELSEYISKIPVDPINDSTYQYTYAHTDSGYELNARLEYFTDHALNDGGNSSGIYEVGNDLTIF